MDALTVRWIDTKGFWRDEFVIEPLTPVMTRRFELSPADAEGERSVVLMFQREAQEGMRVIYREVLKPCAPIPSSPSTDDAMAREV